MPDPFILVFAIMALAGVSTTRYLVRRKDRLLLVEGGGTSEQRKARERAEAAAFKESQRQYFASYGISVVETMSTPRVSDTGTLYLDCDLIEIRGAGLGILEKKPNCRYGCGAVLVDMSEIAPGEGTGVNWDSIGRYCATCGAWYIERHVMYLKMKGPLGRRLRGATNIFDALGPPKTEAAEAEWSRLEAEQSSLEARLNGVRARRLTLAEQLGKPINGGPFRPQLVAKNE